MYWWVEMYKHGSEGASRSSTYLLANVKLALLPHLHDIAKWPTQHPGGWASTNRDRLRANDLTFKEITKSGY